MKKVQWKILFLVIAFCSFLVPVSKVSAGTIYDSPYVEFSQDNYAWTVAEDVPYTGYVFDYQYPDNIPEYWYTQGTVIDTGIESTLRSLRVGEHYYNYDRTGEVPIGYWKVNHSSGSCIHDCMETMWHGERDEHKKCLNSYYSGWFAYCADCNEYIKYANMYMSKDAVSTLTSLDVDKGYYYKCPTCSHLDLTSNVSAHKCKQISWNMYKVIYDSNAAGLWVNGYMADSYHMYNNETVYEGEPVTPLTHLSKCSYSRTGYVFVGWNTEPDGSGTFYEDEAEIKRGKSLSVYDYRVDGAAGEVTLYAQWAESNSTLHIDPNGGKYDGNAGITTVTQKYGTKYEVDDSLVTPPDGYDVIFVENGGSDVEDTVSTMVHNGWKQIQPFNGRFINNIYFFMAPDGNRDTIEAYYEPGSIRLPEISKKNASFGGWYYDAEFTRPAGGIGDYITPSKNLTLYAQWVELKLYSKDNYVDNDKKGAVDLWWTQPDNKGKAYKLYQSLDASLDFKYWTPVFAANNIGSELSVTEDISYSGKEGTYTVPYTGLYTLTAYGAQGGNFGTGKNQKTGGLGGKTTGTFWLTKGDVITYNVGGQDGYGGGGSGETYGANGGGSTTVTVKFKATEEEKILMIAGGGGGASSEGNGGEGGSVLSLRQDGEAEGESGQAGGGAGKVGGTAGEVTVHNHVYVKNSNTDCYDEVDINLLTSKKYGATVVTDEFVEIPDEGDEGELDSYRHKVIRIGSKDNLIKVKKGDELRLAATYSALNTKDSCQDENMMTVYDQNGNKLFSYSAANVMSWVISENNKVLSSEQQNTKKYSTDIIETWDWSDNTLSYVDIWYLTWGADKKPVKHEISEDDDYDADAYYYSSNASDHWFSERKRRGSTSYSYVEYILRKDYTIPEKNKNKKVTGIYIEFDVKSESNWGSEADGAFTKAHLKGDKILICGYEEGEVISSRPAYGGSNYINTDYYISSESKAGIQSGNGAFEIKSVDIGYLDDMRLDGVAAPDKAKPNAVQTEGVNEVTGEDAVVMEPAVSNNQIRVKVKWTEPKDNGTTYYHVVDSHLASTGAKLCTSNIVENTLTTGIKGYYYVVDANDSTQVTINDDFTGKSVPYTYVTLADANTVQYLHIAPIDVAGNLGDTRHIKIYADIRWPIFTKQVKVSDIINGRDQGTVYQKAENEYFVRADGEGAFQLAYESYMQGYPRDNYQINYQIFDSQIEALNTQQRYITKIPYSYPLDFVGNLDVTRFTREVTGEPILRDAMNTGAYRENGAKNNSFWQAFNVPKSLHGQIIKVTPVAGASHILGTVYSDWNDDLTHSALLIADGEAPVISGVDVLDGLDNINHEDGPIYLDLNAVDDLSGLREFKVNVLNKDNGQQKTYVSDANGNILINIVEENSLFYGDIALEFVAVDNVGNERVLEYGVTEFKLEAKIVNANNPNVNVCKKGETAILSVVTYGYCDRVVITMPEGLKEGNESLQLEYIYPSPVYIQEEQLAIVVPLYCETRTYEFIVKAYKDGEELIAKPTLVTIDDETLLDEFRVRIR